MKQHELSLVLTDDEHQALQRLANAEALGDMEIAAAFVLRDALIAQGYLKVAPGLDEATETLGRA